jgi:hypothetical protein
VQQQAFRWQRSDYTLDASDDLPSVDEKWLHRTCEAHEIYCERASGTVQGGARPFRREWHAIPALNTLIEQAAQATNDDSRVVLSEVTVSFIPVTDVVFDLGDTARKGDAGLYSLSVYGFEQAIPPDWRFLNWERIVLLGIAVFLLVVVVVLGFFAFTG